MFFSAPSKISALWRSSGIIFVVLEKYATSFTSWGPIIRIVFCCSARFSKIKTDSYRDNAAVDLWAYFLSGAMYGTNSLLKINVYGGPELTHAAWEGSPESELKKNHRHNPITYPNSIDNFNHIPHFK